MANTRPRKRGRQPANIDTEDKNEQSSSAQPAKQPGDLPVPALRKYIKRYDLQLPMPMTFPGFLLGGSVGKHSESSRKNHHTRRANRCSQPDAVHAVSEHLKGGVIKEADAIAEFLYAMHHRKEEYKLQFGEAVRAPERPVDQQVE